MNQYENKSFEELRLEDYLAGNKGSQGQQPPAPAAGGFGGFGAAPQPAPATGGLFGAPAAAPTGGGLFGSPAPATGGLFGAAPAIGKGSFESGFVFYGEELLSALSFEWPAISHKNFQSTYRLRWTVVLIYARRKMLLVLIWHIRHSLDVCCVVVFEPVLQIGGTTLFILSYICQCL